MTDIEIAQKAIMQRITPLAQERLGIEEEHLEPFGHFKAKLSLDYIVQHLQVRGKRPHPLD